MIFDRIVSMKNVLLSLILFLVSVFAFSQDNALIKNMQDLANSDSVKFLKVKVVVYKKDTLGKILRRFVRDDSIINRKEAMVDRTLKSNPHVEDWRNLKTGSVLNIYLDPKFIDPVKMKKFRKDVKKVANKIEKKVKKEREKDKVKNWSVYYMASLGSFTQQNDEIAKVDFKQNSPLTIGTMYTYYPESKKYSIASSLYFSYLLAASSNVGAEDVDVPLEFGVNSYYQHRIKDSTYVIYGGADFERFSTFNLASVEQNDSLELDQNQMGFATVGISKAFEIGKKALLFKASISQSLFSSRTLGYSEDEDTSSYSGQKLMLFLVSTIKERFFISGLFKYHMLSGPSDVTVMRIGMGCGYFF